mmetsp:Transcript_1374/g.1854  ORF Transcript_1374/g.1854 Transcript_1374/m.1854 type:complete len:95 (-) Transcript_1374:42-326(-)
MPQPLARVEVDEELMRCFCGRCYLTASLGWECAPADPSSSPSLIGALNLFLSIVHFSFNATNINNDHIMSWNGLLEWQLWFQLGYTQTGSPTFS